MNKIFITLITIFELCFVVFGMPVSTKKSQLLDSADFARYNNTCFGDESCFLKNYDLRRFYPHPAFKDPYNKIIRVSFDAGSIPVSVDLAKRVSGEYDLIVKYTDGDYVKINGQFFNASKGKFCQYFNDVNKIIDSAPCSQSFEIIKNIGIMPVDEKIGSCSGLIIEFRDIDKNDNYFEYSLSCEIQKIEMIQIFKNLYIITSNLLQKEGIKPAFIIGWEKRLILWDGNKKKSD
jgi:hypothetical protein